MSQLRDRLREREENLRTWWSEIIFTSPQKKSLLAIAGLVTALSVAFVIRGNSTEIVPPTPPMAVEIVTTMITVDVAGGVKNPGVYELPSQSRVNDAIKAAGEILAGADASDINLARILKDGEQIYIYPPSTSSSRSSNSTHRTTSRTKRAKPSGPIAINRASAKELEALDGIGPVLAQRIVAYRSANGPFMDVADLLKVSGIGAAKFASFKDKIRI